MEGQGSLVSRTMSNSKSHADYTPTHMADMESAKEANLAATHYPSPCELELQGQWRFPLELSLVVFRCQKPGDPGPSQRPCGCEPGVFDG